MTVTGERAIFRDDIERALWRWSEWRADQRGVDEVMMLVDQYAGQSVTVDLDSARREAAQIVQSAQDEAAAIRLAMPSAGAATGQTPVVTYRDARGDVWVRLPPSQEEARAGVNVCTACGQAKRILYFRRDVKAANGRRSQCRDCENAKRRERHRRSK